MGVLLVTAGLLGLLAFLVLCEAAATLRGMRREAKEHAKAQLKTLEDIRQLAWHAQNPEVRS